MSLPVRAAMLPAYPRKGSVTRCRGRVVSAHKRRKDRHLSSERGRCRAEAPRRYRSSGGWRREAGINWRLSECSATDGEHDEEIGQCTQRPNDGGQGWSCVRGVGDECAQYAGNNRVHDVHEHAGTAHNVTDHVPRCAHRVCAHRRGERYALSRQ